MTDKAILEAVMPAVEQAVSDCIDKIWPHRYEALDHELGQAFDIQKITQTAIDAYEAAQPDTHIAKLREALILFREAKAFFGSDAYDDGPEVRDKFEHADSVAELALAGYQPPADTHVLVPREPTEAMLKAGWGQNDFNMLSGDLVANTWKSMIAAHEGETSDGC